MPYLTAQKLVDRFSADRVAQLADDSAGGLVDGVLLQLTIDGGDRSAYTADDMGAADAALANIVAAIDDGESLINSYLAPRYTLPLSAELIASSNLEKRCADIVRYQLMDEIASEEAETRYKDATKWLRDVSMNKASLGESDAVASPTGRMTSQQGVSGTDWSTF